jgi:hypothetical protein
MDQYPHSNEDMDPVAMKLDVINTDLSLSFYYVIMF